ncbi:MAG: hypothetical protein ACOH5I_06010 [Oligoflexus sp.]
MWVWVASLLLLGLSGMAVFHSSQSLRGRKMKSYRRLYLQQLARLEELVAELNHYGNLIQTLKLDEAILLDRFEAALQRIETLLESIHRLPHFQWEKTVLLQIDPLINSCEEQMAAFKKIFRQRCQKAGKSIKVTDEWWRRAQPPVRGCYFCSRPYLPKSFSDLSIKAKEGKKKVWACHVCRAELKLKGEVKILYFQIDGSSRHWSEHPAYDPVRHFGSIGEVSQYQPRPQVHLVKTDEDSAKS